MFKVFITAAVIIGLALAGACTDSPDEDPHVTLVIKHSKLFGDPGPFAELLRHFEQAHPGIRVQSETLPASSDEQRQFYAINLQAKSADFDVFALDVIWVAEFARAGWLRDLTDLLPGEDREDFFGGPMHAVTFNGRIYAMPWFIDAGLLYFRKDLLAKYGYKPPNTWDELVISARAISARETNIHGFVWQGKQYEGLVCNVLEYLWSNGGNVLRGNKAVLDSPENRAALAFMRALITRHGITPEFVTTLTEEPAREIFGKGAAVYLRNWPYAWSLFAQESSPVKGKVGVVVLPHFSGRQSAAALGGWQLGVNRHSRHVREAEKLVAFLTSAPVQKRLALAYGLNPTRKRLYRDPELNAAQPYLRDMSIVFEHARPRPVTPYYALISQTLQSEFSAAIAGSKSADAALTAAQARVEEILQNAR